LPAGHPIAHYATVTRTTETLISDLDTIADPVDRAAAANDLLWTRHPGSSALRTARGLAISEAVELGRSPEEIADRLNVRPDDLTWMNRRTTLSRP
jgi:hypothetical protein